MIYPVNPFLPIVMFTQQNNYANLTKTFINYEHKWVLICVSWNICLKQQCITLCHRPSVCFCKLEVIISKLISRRTLHAWVNMQMKQWWGLPSMKTSESFICPGWPRKLCTTFPPFRIAEWSNYYFLSLVNIWWENCFVGGYWNTSPKLLCRHRWHEVAWV